MSKFIFLLVGGFAILLGGSTDARSAVVNINFEAGGLTPCSFASASPLVSIGGATFAGVDGVGGSILDQCGNFGVNAQLGLDFYAFNTAAGTGTTVDITFGGPVDSFAIYASGGWDSGSFSAKALLGATLVSTELLLTPAQSWGRLEISGVGIFDRVQLAFLTGSMAVYDHLSFNLVNGVPEPATLALLGAAVAGAGFSRRKRAAI